MPSPAAGRAARGTTYRRSTPPCTDTLGNHKGSESPAVICLGRASRRQPVRAHAAPGSEGRRGEMTALDWVLVVAIIVLAGFVLAGLVLGARALRTLQSDRADAQDRQGQAA